MSRNIRYSRSKANTLHLTVAGIIDWDKADHKQIKKACCDLLKDASIPFSDTDSATYGKQHGPKRVKTGWQDVTACLPPNGRMLALEIKTKNDDLSPHQVSVLESLTKVGALIVVARSPDDLKKALREYFKLINHPLTKYFL